MNLQSLTSLSAWQDFVTDKVWQLNTRPSHVRTSSWKLDSNKLADTTIQWPSQYNWSPRKKWADPIRRGLCRWVSVNDKDIHQPSHTVVFELCFKDKTFQVTLDPSDYPRVRDDLAEQSLLYLKMQYQKGGYGIDSILPAGFVTNDQIVYTYLRKLRAIKDLTPAQYKVYGRFSLDFAKDVRLKALNLLNSQERFSFEGSPRVIRYGRFLRETARSDVCIDLPGNGAFCFRLIDYFAVGACVIGPPHTAELHVPLVDKQHIAFTKPDLSDLVELCDYYLQNEDERSLLIANSREYFDTYLHREQLAAYYLSECFERI